ncbi:MAG: flavin reductase family protein [Actinomycetota bacterium]|nr:flavin reductase family protein [Actinomycetota bacterium]
MTPRPSVNPSVGIRLERFLEKLDFPMFIVTCRAGDESSGCLVGFVTQCSMDPTRVLVCLSKKNHTYRVATGASVLAIHLVPHDALDIVELFGSETGDETDKFSRCRWSRGPEDVPLLDACPSRIIGRIVDRTDVGDHVAFLIEPFEAAAGNERIFTFGMARAEALEPGHPA